MKRRLPIAVLFIAGLLAAACTGGVAAGDASKKTEPIQHLVVIFQENVSFDHYFATYPNAKDPNGEPAFKGSDATPSVNGLNDNLLTANTNSAQPRRLGRTPAELLTCDQDHSYGDEQKAFDKGLMDKFVETVGASSGKSPTGSPCDPKQVMDYYDGNSVTALWNYAQRFAMSDNSYGTTFGPSSPGALNLVSGQTHGVGATATPGTSSLNGEIENGSVIGDPQPLGDDCSSRDQVQMTGKNVGDLLNTNNVTWGFFEGGFRPTTAYDPSTGAKAVCGSTHNVGAALGGTGKTGANPWGTKADYIPHHEPFQYYASTANPHHLPPSSPDKIGQTDQAHHQYDLADFWTAANDGNLPAVSFLKAAGYQDGHAAYSDPVDEQQFLVDTINKLQNLSDWKSTAVVIAYDDSDGWYDHQMSPIVNQSQGTADQLTGAAQCGTSAPAGGYQDRCGYGPRLPLLVVSPWARQNYVDHSVTDQSSILRFIEDNWNLGRIGDSSYDAKAGTLVNMFDFSHANNGHLLLDPSTGEPSDS